MEKRDTYFLLGIGALVLFLFMRAKKTGAGEPILLNNHEYKPDILYSDRRTTGIKSPVTSRVSVPENQILSVRRYSPGNDPLNVPSDYSKTYTPGTLDTTDLTKFYMGKLVLKR